MTNNYSPVFNGYPYVSKLNSTKIRPRLINNMENIHKESAYRNINIKYKLNIIKIVLWYHVYHWHINI